LKKQVVIIGAGFAGLSAACHLSKRGYSVKVLEKNDTSGGRARKFNAEGFMFDMGPSWYWMPDVFESFFAHFGKKPSDYYNLVRLDPSYRVYFGKDNYLDMSASMDEMVQMFERIEPGSGKKLQKFMEEAKYKYEVGINDLVHKPGRSLLELADMRIAKGMFNLHLLSSMKSYVRKYFKDERLIQLMEFPVLFLGAMPKDTPALYSLMNYADMSLGTWYPMGGMNKIVEGMVQVAEELGVEIITNSEVDRIILDKASVKEVVTKDGQSYQTDVLIGGADYHHVEQNLLPAEARKYSPKYWDSRKLAPGSLIYYLGVNKKLYGLLHHNLFFDESLDDHAVEIYENPKWPTKPLFYVCCTSKTDPEAAPEGMENIFILIPTATDLSESEGVREHYYNVVMDRMEALTGQSIREHVVYNRSYAHREFKEDYHSFKGNAYGLANTLRQTANLKPSLKNNKLNNLYFTGQLTTPGPGVPPALISGEVVAKEIAKDHA
jgi:phytoene desaturase